MCLTIEDKFDVLEKIGEGQYGQVLKVRDKRNSRDYAMKLYKQDNDQVINQYALRELSFLKKARHPYILELIDVIYIEMNGEKFLSIIMELGKYNLYQYGITHLPDIELAKENFLMILSALNYVHMNGYIHNDVNTNNVVKFDDKVKLIDFTNIKKAHRKYSHDLVPTIISRPIEIVNKKEKGDVVNDFSVDAWGLATVYYFMVNHTELIDVTSDSEQDYNQRIKERFGKNGILNAPHIGDIRQLLHFNPNKRKLITNLFEENKDEMKRRRISYESEEIKEEKLDVYIDEATKNIAVSFCLDFVFKNCLDFEVFVVAINNFFRLQCKLENYEVYDLILLLIVLCWLSSKVVSDTILDINQCVEICEYYKVDSKIKKIIDIHHSLLEDLDWDVDPETEYKYVDGLTLNERKFFDTIILYSLTCANLERFSLEVRGKTYRNMAIVHAKDNPFNFDLESYSAYCEILEHFKNRVHCCNFNIIHKFASYKNTLDFCCSLV